MNDEPHTGNAAAAAPEKQASLPDPAAEPLGDGGLPEGDELLRPVFPHPPWAVGMALVIAVPFLVLGLVGHWVWLLLGSPFILVLFVWVSVRLVERNRRRQGAAEAGPETEG
jgi:hypothetical protein